MRLLHLFLFYFILKLTSSIKEINDTLYDEEILKGHRLYVVKPDLLLDNNTKIPLDLKSMETVSYFFNKVNFFQNFNFAKSNYF